MTKLVIPVVKCDDADNGGVVPVTALETVVSLQGGFYKIASMGTSLLWKLGAVSVDVTTGSYLPDGSQETILVPAGGADLRAIRSNNSTTDGELNIVVVNLFEVPGVEPRAYLS